MAELAEVIRTRRGLDIPMKGAAEKTLKTAERPGVFAIKPPDFNRIRPKLLAKQGDEIKAGSPVFYDKDNDEDLYFTSPVSGEVADVVRGAKRRVLEVRIVPDKKETSYEQFGKADPNELSREEIVNKMKLTGTWNFLRKRPFSKIPHPGEDPPKAIFISAFDSAPLGPDYDYILKDKGSEFQTGIDALSKLCSGPIHLNVSSEQSSDTLLNADKVQVNTFEGPHPVSNVGVQVHHLDPLCPGEVIWYINPQDVAILGRMFQQGILDATRTVALTGQEVTKPQYYNVVTGTSIKPLIEGNVSTDKKLRYISGNALTGEQIQEDGFIGHHTDHITVLPEGDQQKFFLTEGWLSPGFDKFTNTRLFASAFLPAKKGFSFDTNKNGEKRAYVQTGQYEKVFPFDIYPVQLVKAILIQDIELMEDLGIYEVAAEDFALCEFVCTSKMNVQEIVQEGLDTFEQEVK